MGNSVVNASIRDTGGTYAENLSTSLEIYALTAMLMSPNALTWATLELGTTNQTATNDPIVINNTGNIDIGAGGIIITGYDLQGASITTDFIRAQNFSIHHLNGTADCSGPTCLECAGTALVNKTATAISIANLTAGNNSINALDAASGQEALFICLKTVPSEIARQTYNTSGAATSSWVIAVG